METNLFETAQTFRFEAKIDYAEGGIVSKRVIDRPTGNVSFFAFDKGQRLSEHTAPFDALVQVVEGQAEIVINGVTYKVLAGESVIMPANITHAVNAVEKFKMILTMIKG